ncbi:MAG: hypothetical protein DWQ06_03990 [Calditrichaeota bacterium]|nr:MAG: hypothetical protein DWQ06_03990 [Calditrichota bacterium]
MRQQYHFRNSEKGLLVWDILKLIDLTEKLETKLIPLSEIKELDEAFWYDLGDSNPTCRNILEHSKLIDEADLSYPIILCNKGKIMDGMHRVCKALKIGKTHIEAIQFENYIEPDFVGIDLKDLKY